MIFLMLIIWKSVKCNLLVWKRLECRHMPSYIWWRHVTPSCIHFFSILVFLPFSVFSSRSVFCLISTHHCVSWCGLQGPVWSKLNKSEFIWTEKLNFKLAIRSQTIIRSQIEPGSNHTETSPDFLRPMHCIKKLIAAAWTAEQFFLLV